MRVLRMFQRLARMLVSGLVILFPLLLGDTMGMRGGIVQFGGFLVVFPV